MDNLGLIENESGQHFDPRLVRLFLGIEMEVRRIATEYSDAANTANGNNVEPS